MDAGGSTSISNEQLRAIVPMDDDDLHQTFRKARSREAATYGNLKRKFRLLALRTNLADVRVRKQECNTRVEILRRENRELRKALAETGVVVPRSETTTPV